MCGFVGILDRNNNSRYDIESSLKRIYHRGPDEQRTESIDEKIHIGFSRLAIIDLNGGSQPMSNSDKTITVMLNGEIYNYIELSNQLRKENVIFDTTSDTEVFLKMYEKYGIEMLEKLQGMFGFIIIDKKKKVIYAGRDRIGIKPLYYSEYNNSFSFASEIKPLMDLYEDDLTIRKKSVADFLQYRYVHAPYTIFDGIKKVIPGHYLKVPFDNSEISDICYWDSYQHKESFNEDESECKERTLSLLKESVKLHLRSDVKLGLFLSGGIDSGMLVALASEQQANLNTYTLRFENGDYDESELAELVAKRYGTNHHCYTVKSDDIKDLLPEMLWYFDEPLGDPGVLPNYIINRYVHEDGIKVILSGAGGDELFAGYSWYFATEREKIINKHPFIFYVVSKIISIVNPELSNKISRALLYRTDVGKHMIVDQQVFRKDEIMSLLSDDSEGESIKESYLRTFSGDELNAMLYTDIKTYLTDDLLLLADRSCMAFSVEGRVPFLHHPLVEYALDVPGKIKAANSTRKRLLRDIAKDYLPEELINAPKRGFTSPVQRWSSDSFGDFAYEILNDERAFNRGIYDARAYKALVGNRKSYTKNFHKIYLLLVLEIFFRVHCDNRFDSAASIDKGKIY